MNFFRLVILLLLLSGGKILSQQPQRKIDSLRKVMGPQQDTARAATMLRLGWALFNVGEYKEAKELLANAHVLCGKLDFKLGSANALYTLGVLELYQGSYASSRNYFFASEKYYLKIKHELNLTSVYNSIGVSYFREGNFDRSLEYYEKSLKIDEKLNKKSGIATTLTNIAGVYYIRGNITKAFEYTFRSLKMEQELGNKSGEAGSLATIGIMYQDLKEVDKALSYSTQALKLYEKIGDKSGAANCYMNIGNNYVHQLKFEEDDSNLKKDPENDVFISKALASYNSGLPLAMELGDKSLQAAAYEGIGTIYAITKDYNKALPLLIKAYNGHTEVNDARGVCIVGNTLAKTYKVMNQLDKALEYSNKSQALAKEMMHIESMITTEKILSEIYSSKNDAQKAMEHYKRHIKLRDSVFDIEHKKEVANISAKYETEIKEKENKELTLANQVQQSKLDKNKYFIFGLVALLLLCLGVAYLIIFRNKLKHTQTRVKLEQKLLRSQMNPHFIFNALTAIESFIYKNEPREAGKYLSGFARLMRLILENSREDYVSLEKEINTLEHYLNLQKLRYDNAFSYTINIDENIDISAITIPPMLAQPFIENSIEHGLKNIGRHGEIALNFILKDNELVFEARDNGIGFERSMAIKNKESGHRSMATTITLERLKNLNRNKSKKIKWLSEDIKDHIDNVLGSRVVFTIPFKEL